MFGSGKLERKCKVNKIERKGRRKIDLKLINYFYTSLQTRLTNFSSSLNNFKIYKSLINLIIFDFLSTFL